jgi:hypothetical protein
MTNHSKRFTTRRRKGFTDWQVLFFSMLGFALVVGACCFMPNPMHTEASIYESPAFATATEARKHLAIALPDEATNIRFSGYRQWIAADDIMRFEAPVEVCLQHATMMLSGRKLEPLDGKDLAEVATRPISSNFQDVSWFDLAKATNVVHARGGSHQPAIWIDQDRGTFYYHMTD